MPFFSPRASAAVLVLAALSFAGPVAAQAQKAPAKPAQGAAKSNSPLSNFGSGSKEPYKIDANKLEVQQQANSATYSGDVVVVQGKMTMRCTKLVIFFDQKSAEAKTAAARGNSATGATPAASPAANAGGLKRLECHGPVSINQEKQTATANNLVYESDTVTLTGNVVISDGDNVQAGEKMVYNTKTGIGTVEGGRVRGIFTPGQGDGKPKAR